ncbi:hypothetical protein [Pseudoalteromonas ruthenica]|uniref:Uncharacterized protein n=1 Tax=Pseudoalteromonas ruthenica TaxID=151081 RepID=A0A0F4PMM7_9GAMM|nr:hypothetical protein [Pseudoalteromonas ruthenica]KJY96667.1 hypothetical protein TW76_11440 [Pseudoalteromonas ruthenica]KJY98538.1 hypothetical protein TW72_12455 [Pseudoalteromonas ruthenica]TMO91260.1 hypothetical protein CWC13_15620 [Pseudoalteromonas ruthenica]TMO97947.1 hypothetical protein CWC07_12810 [Pseudoalteromonas ruthenica]TMP06840.1 hypothetical protein CWC09_10745 [Pseudoalteromonas ruthenica]
MEAINIFNDLIEQSPKNKKLLEIFYANKFEKYTLAATGLCITTFFILYAFDSLREWSPFALITAFILIIAYACGQFIFNISSLKNPSKDVLVGIAESLDRQVLLTQRLGTYSSWNLHLAKSRVEYDIDRISTRLGFLLGAMDKLGIIPAALGLYLVYAKTFGEPQLENIPYPVLGFLGGLYLGAFSAVAIISRFKYLKMVLTHAIDLALQREAALKQPLDNVSNANSFDIPKYKNNI